MRLHRKYLAAVIIFALAATTTWNEVLVKPFPFLKVEYVSDLSEWDSEPSSLAVDVSVDVDSDLVPDDINRQLNEIAISSFEDKVLWGATLARSLQSESKGESIRTISNIFTRDNSFKLVCSEGSKIFVAAMSTVNVPARVVWMHGHTVSEAYDGSKWILIDTYGNVRSYDSTGRPLSLAKTLENYESVTFTKVVPDNWTKPANYLDSNYFSNVDNVYKSQNLALVVRGSDLFDFNVKTRNIELILQALSGYDRDSVGQSMQLVLEDSYKVGNFGVGLIDRF